MLVACLALLLQSRLLCQRSFTFSSVQLLQRLGFQVAPAAVAREFSVEQVFQEKPCGLHKAYNYLTVQQLNTVLCHVEATYRTLANQAHTTKK